MKRRDFCNATLTAGLLLGSPRFLRAIGADDTGGRPPRPAGLRTGIRDLDAMLGGLRPGELVVLAGPSGAGKTCLAAQIAVHAAVGGGIPVAYFSAEDFGDDVRRLMACQLACVDRGRERTGPASDGGARRLREAAGTLRAAPLTVDAWFRLHPEDLTALARRRVREDGARLLVVDSHPVLHASRDRGFAARLRGLARELDVPVLALTQTRVPGELHGAAADRVLLLRRPAGGGREGRLQTREILAAREGAGAPDRARLCFWGGPGRFFSGGLQDAVEGMFGIEGPAAVVRGRLS